MSNFSTFGQISQAIPGTGPALFICSTPDNLGTITAAGYLNDLGTKVKAGDKFMINYSDLSVQPVGGANANQSATYGEFIASVSGSNISLVSSLFVGGLTSNNVIQYASVPVTAAQFNGMYAAPYQLVAAQGANTLIVVNRLELVLTYGSAAFASGGVVFAQYDSTANGAGVKATNTEAAADFFATASTTYVIEGLDADPLPFATTVNKGLYLSNATGAFTTGTGSAFVAKVHYYVIATA